MSTVGFGYSHDPIWTNGTACQMAGRNQSAARGQDWPTSALAVKPRAAHAMEFIVESIQASAEGMTQEPREGLVRERGRVSVQELVEASTPEWGKASARELGR